MNVSAVIPAYNEELTIADIVSVLKAVDLITEIIVVSDGSEDRTAEEARKAGATVIELKQNVGKAGAMKAGFGAAGQPVLLFLDADLIGLSPDHVRALLSPVVQQEADMAIGIFGEGRISTDLAQFVAPYLSGQRAVRRELLVDMFENEPDIDSCGFGIETVLTRYVKGKGMKVVEVPLEEMSHRMKEEKRGLVKGMAARLKMYYEILKYVQKG